MKNRKNMGSVLRMNFYMQTYVYIYTFAQKLYVQPVDFFFPPKVRHHLLETILTLKTCLWENKTSF